LYPEKYLGRAGGKQKVTALCESKYYMSDFNSFVLSVVLTIICWVDYI
jgi:hypothetical protein